MEEIQYKLQVFEGPLDLLLHLIDINKIDIYDIPIAEITDQYLAYIHEMELDDMELASEFLVMAAELLRIKSKMLLPIEKKEEEEEDADPRESLVQRLLQYKTYKYLSQELKKNEYEASKCIYKGTTIPGDIEYIPEPVDLAQLLKNIELSDLQRVFLDVIKKSADKIDPIRSNFGKIQEEPVDYAKRSREIRHTIRSRKKNTSFRKLLSEASSKEEVIVTFLVILEMMKDGTVHTRQDQLFDDIYIEVTQPGEDLQDEEDQQEEEDQQDEEGQQDEEDLQTEEDQQDEEDLQSEEKRKPEENLQEEEGRQPGEDLQEEEDLHSEEKRKPEENLQEEEDRNHEEDLQA